MSAKEEPIASYLREAIDRRGITASQLSAYIDVSHVTVGRWIKGEDVPSPENCRKLARYFHIPEDRLLSIAGHRSEAAEAPPRIPYTELLRRAEEEMPVAIPVVEQIVHAGEGAPLDYVYLPPATARGKRLVAAYVRGDCMAPVIQEGDLVIVDMEASPQPQDIVVALVDHDDVEIKRFIRRSDGMVVLGCENPAYPECEVQDIKVLGVVIQATKKLKG